MECKDYRDQFTALLTDSLGEPERRSVENHLAGCADCRMEFEAARKIWALMGSVNQPAPSESMRQAFDVLLKNYKHEVLARRNPWNDILHRLTEYWLLQAKPRMAFSIVLVAGGLIAGYLIHQPGESAVAYSRKIDSLSSQVSDIKQVMMLSLLKDPSASQRIQAVSYTDDLNNVDNKVIGALFKTLNEDPNVNVRLATLEALVKLAEEPRVREGLVRSIDLQNSPLMQSAIADAMVKLQEKSSVQSLKRLLNKKDLNPMVKINIEKNIQKLI